MANSAFQRRAEGADKWASLSRPPLGGEAARRGGKAPYRGGPFGGAEPPCFPRFLRFLNSYSHRFRKIFSLFYNSFFFLGGKKPLQSLKKKYAIQTYYTRYSDILHAKKALYSDILHAT